MINILYTNALSIANFDSVFHRDGWKSFRDCSLLRGGEEDCRIAPQSDNKMTIE